ncbi:MAG: hypothetical protein COT25_03330 [Candidatus Kerfeldbacteria bacterium CG08_land_8_20_14_0_20_42_7]|uniref:HMA domain-containing protein n=1 Tax=Candidatus Kerfeldbacteria bacterium CG08_land_8_20_14_0_20_42_7 TaxID=2014245 RepID=A0A2H0YSG9_9BACT|nr:MAG: hypothetical protein COT25_03330 [Candidatus Kerfeldbacteria bacterium CG08_land_8_20_14_0_20_42_7]
MFFKKSKVQSGEVAMFQIGGMHCVSCAMNIDGELEDTDGVIESATNYAKQTTEVTYNPSKVGVKDIEALIRKLSYTAKQIK